MVSIFWLVAAILFCICEAISVGLTSIWFAAGAVAALLTSLGLHNFWLQCAVFLAVSLFCLLLIRPLAQRYVAPRHVSTNADRVVGQTAIVTQTIDNAAGQGQISVGGNIWTARSQEEPPIPVDTLVQILRIEGVKVIVVPVENVPAPTSKEES